MPININGIQSHNKASLGDRLADKTELSLSDSLGDTVADKTYLSLSD